MKLRFLMILIGIVTITEGVMAQSPVTHERVFDTIPFIMDHHNRRLMKFQSEPMGSGEIVFLGNSITEGGDWARLTGLSNTLNRGIGGDITYGLLARINTITARKPRKLFILIGVNDIGKDIPDAVIANNVKKLLGIIKSESPDTQVFVQSILPVNPEYPGFPQHYNKQYHVLMTNQLLERVSIEEGVTFINLFPFFLDEHQRLRMDLTPDGLHLNENGYRLWVDLLKSRGYL